MAVFDDEVFAWRPLGEELRQPPFNALKDFIRRIAMRFFSHPLHVTTR